MKTAIANCRGGGIVAAMNLPDDIGGRKMPVTSLTGIVVTWNRRQELERCLASIEAQLIPDWLKFDTIVVDDGSNDGTANYLAEWSSQGRGRRAIRLPRNFGPGTARNLGLDLTNSRFVFLIDSDAFLVTPTALGKMLRYLVDHDEIGMVGCSLWEDDQCSKPWLLGGYLTSNLHADLPRWKLESANVDFVTSCCSIWRREAIVDAGGFDPFYGHGVEDVDLSLRVSARGWKMAMLSEVNVIHQMSHGGRRRDFEDFDEVFDYLEWTRSYLFLKHHGYWATWKALLHWISARDEFIDAYKVPLSRTQCLRAQVLYPFIHLLRYPWYHWACWNRSYLCRSVAFEEIG